MSSGQKNNLQGKRTFELKLISFDCDSCETALVLAVHGPIKHSQLYPDVASLNNAFPHT